MRNHTARRQIFRWPANYSNGLPWFGARRRHGGWKATWKHVSRRVACLSRLITRNAPTGRFVVTHRETRYWNFTSSARELLRSCVIRAISHFNLRADIILPVLFRWEVFLGEVEVEMRRAREIYIHIYVYVLPSSPLARAPLLYSTILRLWPGVMHIPRIYRVH